MIRYLQFGTVFVFLHYCTFFSAQTSKEDSLCCMCYKVDSEQISHIISYKNLIKNLDFSYINLTVSLSENMDINFYEKLVYIQSLDKQLKYDISKKIYLLDSLNDSVARKNSFELNKLKSTLKNKIHLIQLVLEKCEQKEEVRNYIYQRKLINDIDPDYYKNFINLTNSTIDNDTKDYEKLLELEKKIQEKITARLNKMELKGKLNWSNHEQIDYQHFQAIKKESLSRSNQFLLAEKEKNNNGIKKLSEQDNKNKIIIRALINYSDTVKFVYNADIDQRLLVNKDTFSYYFLSDSAITKVHHYQTYNPTPLKSISGFFYSIQIGTYNKEITFGKLLVKRDLLFQELSNGNVSYFYGMFLKKEEVDKIINDFRFKGFNDFSVVAINNGELISLDEAIKISEKIFLTKQ